jgi:hypothetical protein
MNLNPALGGSLSKDRDSVIRPSQVMGVLLDAAYRIWGPILASPIGQNESFVYGRDDMDEFSSHS